MDQDTLIITVAKQAVRIEQLTDALAAARATISRQVEMITQSKKEVDGPAPQENQHG